MSAPISQQQPQSTAAPPSRRRVVRAALLGSMVVAAVVYVALTTGDGSLAGAFLKSSAQRKCEWQAHTTRADYEKACADAEKACITNSCHGQRHGSCKNTCKKVQSACKAAAYDRMQIDMGKCAHATDTPPAVAVAAPPSPNVTEPKETKPDEPPVPMPKKKDYRKPYPILNEYCVGKKGPHGNDDDHNGRGYICLRALGKPGCTTKSELKSLYCACCECYVECGMSNTQWDVCHKDSTCAAPPS